MKTKSLLLIASLATLLLSAACRKDSLENDMRIQIAQDVAAMNTDKQTAVVDSISYVADKEHPTATAYLSIFIDGQQMHNHFTQLVTYTFEADDNGILSITSKLKDRPRLLEQTPILPKMDENL